MGKRRVAKILKAPDNLGRDAERRIDAMVFGYDEVTGKSELDPNAGAGDENDEDEEMADYFDL